MKSHPEAKPISYFPKVNLTLTRSMANNTNQFGDFSVMECYSIVTPLLEKVEISQAK